jgi:uncharacterized protein YecE (DUF72 family)
VVSIRLVAATVRIGTCSWADESLSKYFYPSGLAAGERLGYYAERFDTVEVDSTFYRLPVEEMVARWAERTPDGFVMHVKAFGIMTRHPVKADRLPPDLRKDAPVDDRGRVERPSREFRAEVFERFHAALEPLRAAGKLGGILMQFASYVVYRPQSLEYLEWAQEQLQGDQMLVEFRHRSWLEEENRSEVLSFLEERGMALVIVDAPRLDSPTVIPTVVALTTPTAYVRMHGRNADTWHRRGGGAAERFDYLYPEEELREWVEPLSEVSQAAEQAFVLFNTNSRSSDGRGGWVAQGADNAFRLRKVLSDAGLHVS